MIPSWKKTWAAVLWDSPRPPDGYNTIWWEEKERCLGHHVHFHSGQILPPSILSKRRRLLIGYEMIRKMLRPDSGKTAKKKTPCTKKARVSRKENIETASVFVHLIRHLLVLVKKRFVKMKIIRYRRNGLCNFLKKKNEEAGDFSLFLPALPQFTSRRIKETEGDKTLWL